VAKRRKIEITIRTDRRVLIYATGLGRMRCEQCGTEREVVTLQTASLLANSLSGDLTNGTLAPGLHLSLAPDGSSRVCVESLMRSASQGNKLSRTILSGPDVIKGLLP
jgi:hypothetical protein